MLKMRFMFLMIFAVFLVCASPPRSFAETIYEYDTFIVSDQAPIPVFQGTQVIDTRVSSTTYTDAPRLFDPIANQRLATPVYVKRKAKQKWRMPLFSPATLRFILATRSLATAFIEYTMQPTPYASKESRSLKQRLRRVPWKVYAACEAVQYAGCMKSCQCIACPSVATKKTKLPRRTA